MSDVLIVGGGVIGLSLAYELAGHGARVRVIDAGAPGREASWAGAGILPPAAADSDDPLEQLTALSNHLHRRWHDELLAETGIDNGYRCSGAIYLARSRQDAESLAQFAGQAAAGGIACQRRSADDLAEVEPRLRPAGDLAGAYLLPDECQIRNPRHLKALMAACVARGVEITQGVAAQDFEIRAQRVHAVRTNLGSIAADRVCVTTGAWTAALCEKLGAVAALKPIRGQIVLLTTPGPLISHIINEGRRYLVPRADGRLLVGSTEEDVGFDRRTTAGAIAELLDFAVGLVPALAGAAVERYWSGLRPATADGLPYLSQAPGFENAFVAAGHYRSGLQLSTGTALVMGEWMRSEPPQINLAAFRLDRGKREGQPALPARRAPRAIPLHESR
jgi:glycine oxidase